MKRREDSAIQLRNWSTYSDTKSHFTLGIFGIINTAESVVTPNNDVWDLWWMFLNKALLALTPPTSMGGWERATLAGSNTALLHVCTVLIKPEARRHPFAEENNPPIPKMATHERLHLKTPKPTHSKSTHKTMDKDVFVSSCSLQILRLHEAHSVWLSTRRFSMISQRGSGRNSAALIVTHFSRLQQHR